MEQSTTILNEGDNFFPPVLIYPNTFIQGQYVYIIKQQAWYIMYKHIIINFYV